MDIEFLKAPGSSLIGGDKLIFDEIRSVVDNATNELLIRPDWDANLRCIELIMPLQSSDILNEVTFILRKKLRSSSPRIVVLTLRLMEALMNNGSNYWHNAMNDERVTKDVAMVARTYCKRTGSDNRDVAETCLDIVQHWGEQFLTRKKQYGKIVDLYLDLRKEGLPFRINNQFDANRVPIFTPPLGSISGDSLGRSRDSTDGILAAAMQTQLDLDRERYPQYPMPNRLPPTGSSSAANSRPNSTRLPSSTPTNMRYPSPQPAVQNQRVAASPSFNSPFEVLHSLHGATSILSEMVSNAVHVGELRNNEVIDDIASQLMKIQRAVTVAIERSMDSPELLEKLFAVNDSSQSILRAYSEAKNGSISLEEAKRSVNSAIANMPSLPPAPMGVAGRQRTSGGASPAPAMMNTRGVPPPMQLPLSGQNSRTSSRSASPQVRHYYQNAQGDLIDLGTPSSQRSQSPQLHSSRSQSPSLMQPVRLPPSYASPSHGQESRHAQKVLLAPSPTQQLGPPPPPPPLPAPPGGYGSYAYPIYGAPQSINGGPVTRGAPSPVGGYMQQPVPLHPQAVYHPQYSQHPQYQQQQPIAPVAPQSSSDSSSTKESSPMYRKMLAKSDSLSNEQIITQADDPFAPEALDALFDRPLPAKKDKSSDKEPVPSSGASVSSASSNGSTPLDNIFDAPPKQHANGMPPPAPTPVYPPRHPQSQVPANGGQQQYAYQQPVQYSYPPPGYSYAPQPQYVYAPPPPPAGAPQYAYGYPPGQPQMQQYLIPQQSPTGQPTGQFFVVAGPPQQIPQRNNTGTGQPMYLHGLGSSSSHN